MKKNKEGIQAFGTMADIGKRNIGDRPWDRNIEGGSDCYDGGKSGQGVETHFDSCFC